MPNIHVDFIPGQKVWILYGGRAQEVEIESIKTETYWNHGMPESFSTYSFTNVSDFTLLSREIFTTKKKLIDSL
jgi:hypothetical protein